ncbi:MAG: hypothetical protein DWQ19_12250 [Crenarchaeota archaeon]|nr:MAG: hypothetical protein DWQ19_12250 [Thermoproteota archaeon]
MKYLLQKNRPVQKGMPDPNGWETISGERAGHQEFDDLATAERIFKTNINMARMAVFPQRIIDSEGTILSYYDPREWYLEQISYDFNHTTDENERTKLVEYYAHYVRELIATGLWLTIPPIDARLPDNYMPKEFFEYWNQ